MKYILVSGGLGYIGSHTVVDLLQSGYGVVIVDNLSNSSVKCLERLRAITGKEIDFHNVDILDFEKMCELLAGYKDEKKIYGVIHFAAFKAVGESTSDPLKYYHNNVTGSINLLRAMEKNGVDKFIFSSSACVYGTTEKCYESSDICPQNPYGRTKTMVEYIMQDVAKSIKGFNAISLRYFNPIGAHPSGMIGEVPGQLPNNLMPFIQKVASGQLPQLRVFGTDYPTKDGTGVRDYIHVVDLARGHVAALEKIERIDGFMAYNLGTGRPTSVFELVSAFEKASGVKIPLELTDRRPGDVAIYYAMPDFANQELSWKADLNVEDMCRDTWRWTSQNPNGYE